MPQWSPCFCHRYNRRYHKYLAEHTNNKTPNCEIIGIHDIEFVCGFDVGENKVGKKINEAIYEKPNMVNWIPKESMPKTDALVYEGPAHDGVGIWVENKVNPIKSGKTDEQLREQAIKVIKDTGVEILVSYLPVGSEQATQFWAQVCLDTKTAFVNCIPSFIALYRGYEG